MLKPIFDQHNQPHNLGNPPAIPPAQPAQPGIHPPRIVGPVLIGPLQRVHHVIHAASPVQPVPGIAVHGLDQVLEQVLVWGRDALVPVVPGGVGQRPLAPVEGEREPDSVPGVELVQGSAGVRPAAVPV
jgi:hypothetical protein